MVYPQQTNDSKPQGKPEKEKDEGLRKIKPDQATSSGDQTSAKPDDDEDDLSLMEDEEDTSEDEEVDDE